MKYLYSWLKEFYPEVPALDQLSDLLIQLGHDVESVEPISYNGVVVAEITALKPHPNADKLTLVSITTGNETHEVVCGAPHLVVGQKVAYATLGTTLPCGITIKEATIRGEKSFGMLCAEDELGLGGSHAGLMPLPDNATLGEPIASYIDQDAIISLDITRNRGDVLSHFGLARDIKAGVGGDVLQATFRKPSYANNTPAIITEPHADVNSLNFGLVEYETMLSTPLIMQSRLSLLGQKTINLPTDITNYLLLAYGQPLHAYDYNKLGENPVMSARRAHNGEPLNGLNGKTYTLSPQALVITVNDTTVALAGILGGELTKVTGKTTRVLFEAAHFNSKAITVASRGLDLMTESAMRWEREVDPTLAANVLAHAQVLLTEASQGTAFTPVTYDTAVKAPETITISTESISQTSGLKLSSNDITSLLTRLGIKAEHSNDTLTVTAPSWRPDLTIAPDYTEEVVRLVGLQNIPKQPLLASVPQWRRSKWWRYEHLKDIVNNLGGYEIMTYPFVSNEELTLFTPKAQVPHLITSAIEGKDRMRASLKPAMLQTIASNPEEPFLALYEVNKVYTSQEEPVHICISVSGSDTAAVDGWWQHFFERLRLPLASWMSRVETVSDEIKDMYKVRKPYVTMLELPIETLPVVQNYDLVSVAMPDIDNITYTPVSKYQASRRDIAVIVADTITPDALNSTIKDLDPLITDVSIFDIFRDPAKIGESKQSIGLRITYQAPDHTLTSDEITTLHDRVETHLKEHYHGIIR